MTLQMRVETITPEKAADWLTRNRTNRPVSMIHVNRLAKAMMNDEWELNGETIKFNGDELADGQHRLHGVIKSGKTIQSYVVRGLESRCYDTIDQGKSRTLGDVLARSGEKNYNLLAASLSWLKALNEGLCEGHARRADTKKALHLLLDQHPRLRDSVDFVKACINKKIRCPGGMLAALHYLFRFKDRDMADLFVQRIADGENIDSTMPEYKIRTVLINQAGALKKMPIESLCMLVIKAWNAVRSGQRIKSLKTTQTEIRPQII